MTFIIFKDLIDTIKNSRGMMDSSQALLHCSYFLLLDCEVSLPLFYDFKSFNKVSCFVVCSVVF